MEAPGLDLGGSGLDFRRFWTSQTMPEGFSWVANALPPTCPASLGRSRAKSDRDVAKSQDVCLECLCFRVLAAMGEVLTEWGGRRCPPPGGFQSAGHRRCANSVPNSFPTGSVQSQLANLDILSSSSFAQFDLKCSFPYPFLSPGAWGSPEPNSKKSLSASCWLILVVFFAFPTAPVK